MVLWLLRCESSEGLDLCCCTRDLSCGLCQSGTGSACYSLLVKLESAGRWYALLSGPQHHGGGTCLWVKIDHLGLALSQKTCSTCEALEMKSSLITWWLPAGICLWANFILRVNQRICIWSKRLQFVALFPFQKLQITDIHTDVIVLGSLLCIESVHQFPNCLTFISVSIWLFWRKTFFMIIRIEYKTFLEFWTFFNYSSWA